MPTFIYPQCACGRRLRAAPEQMGTAIRCWSCGAQVVVPRQGDGRRLALAFVRCGRVALSPISLGVAFGAGMLASALLTVPVAGVWLLGIALAAGAWGFQSLIRGSGSDEEAEPSGRPPWAASAVRLGLAAPAALVVLAPFYVRNGGKPLPYGPALGGAWALPLSLFAWWIALPIAMVAANAIDRNGAVGPRKALAALAARPAATLAALAVVPVGLLVVELVLAFATVEQGYMQRLLNGAFPSPTLRLQGGVVHLVYRYDDCVWDVPFTDEGVELLPVYLSGVRRGYTLLGEVPGSLTSWAPPDRPALFLPQASVPVTVRFLLSALGLAGAFSVLGLQARWLGSLVAVGLGVQAAAPAHTGPANVVSLDEAVGAAPSESSPAPLPAPATSARPPVPLALASRPPSVLIIDDEAQCAETLARILIDEGLLVATATSARDGLALAAAARPDLIILDLLLPDRSGLEVCRTLRAEEATRDIPILMLTYRGTAEDEVSGLEEGADDYVAKPYVVEVLIARIRKRLGLGRNGAQAPRPAAEARDNNIAVLAGS